MSNYTSKDIKTLEGMEAIRKRPGMYVGGANSQGMHHVLLEVISNSVDEALNGHGNEIKISIDTKLNKAEVEDYGRGIPFGKMENGNNAMIELATKLHSGGKFGQGGYNVSGGLHGVGLTATNALSSDFRITSVRDGKVGMSQFSKGKLENFTEEKSTAKHKSGTTVSFIPDTEIFGDIKFDGKKITEQIRELSFLSTGIKFILAVDGKKEVFHSKEGLKDMIKFHAGNELTTNVVYHNVPGKKLSVEVAFGYTKAGSEKIISFTNNIPNKDGGSHVTGFKLGMTKELNKLAKQHEFVKKNDSNLDGGLLRKGVIAAVSIKMAEEPEFQGQTKEKLLTSKLSDGTTISSSVSSALKQAIGLELSKKDLKTILEKALIEKDLEEKAKRAREAANKVKTGGGNKLKAMDFTEKLSDCNDRNGELWICEGDSAGGSAKQARDHKTMAILPLRGKPRNTFNLDLAECLENKEIKDLVTVLGAGIGEKFNIKNLRYGKIILMADADDDGKHINLLMMAFFLRHMPELVKQGKVYRSVSPLFSGLKGKKKLYFYTAKELDEYLSKNGELKDITRYKGLGELNADQLWETTMNPEERKMIQMTTSDMEKTMELYEVLMGKKSSARREFIVEHGEII